MTGYRAILVSNNRLLRHGIRDMLEKSQISVIAEGRDLRELSTDHSEENCADLVILHLASDQRAEAAVALVHDLRSRFHAAKLVILADACVRPILPDLLGADVSAVLMTDISGDILQHSLDLVRADHRLYPADTISLIAGAIRSKPWLALRQPDEPQQLAPPENGTSKTREDCENRLCGLATELAIAPLLSKRECEVVQCLAGGLSNKTIARQLNITEGTVKVHVKGLLRKVKAANRTQLAIWALRQDSVIGTNANGHVAE
jgi:two-component system nitrate/nitrite response regulator NarL